MGKLGITVVKKMSPTMTLLAILAFSLFGFIFGLVSVNWLQAMRGSKPITCGLWRPRYTALSEHNQPKEVSDRTKSVNEKFLFVGVMTARKFLSTRASASNKTWGPRVPGKVVYFLEQGVKYEGDLEVVQLEGVRENDYPPQRKSFAMISYISKHYAREYEWIVRADDDLYIKVDELVRFLKSLDSRRLLYIGQPGVGKTAEKGKLGLTGAYCMGGPGVAMSSRLIATLSPHLEGCLNSTITGHEDTELGRCLSTRLKIFCSSSLEMRALFYQNYAEDWDKNSSFKKTLGKGEETALTLHPVKVSSYVFKLENFLFNRTIEKLKLKQTALRAELAKIVSQTLTDKKSDRPADRRVTDDYINWFSSKQRVTANKTIDIQGATNSQVTNGQQPTRTFLRDSVWDAIRGQSIYSASLESGQLNLDRTYKGRHILHSDTSKKLSASEWFTTSEGTSEQLEFLDVAYQRLDSTQGTEEIFIATRLVNQINCTAPVLVRRNFPPQLLEFREAIDDNIGAGSITIHILLVMFKRSASYEYFLERHRKAVENYGGKVDLRVVVFTDEAGEYKHVIFVTDVMTETNLFLDITIIHVNETYGLGSGLLQATRDLQNTSLLLLMDVGMEYTSDFLQRVYRNTVIGHMAYFPVVFSLFSPKVACHKRGGCERAISNRHDNAGAWNGDRFSIVSIYKKDLLRTGILGTQISGRDLEDSYLYERVMATGVTVIRAADTGIIHRYDPRDCDSFLPGYQREVCQHRQDNFYGSVNYLHHIYLSLTATEA